MASSLPSAACGHVDDLAVTCSRAACVDTACLKCAREGYEEAPDPDDEGRPPPREFETWERCGFCAVWFCAACAENDTNVCASCLCSSCATCSRVGTCQHLNGICLSCGDVCIECNTQFCKDDDDSRYCNYCGKTYCDDCACGYFCEPCNYLKFSCEDCNRVRACDCENAYICADHSTACVCGASWLCAKCEGIKCLGCGNVLCKTCPQFGCSFCDDAKFCADCVGDGQLCDFCEKYSCAKCDNVRPCSVCSKLVCKDDSLMLVCSQNGLWFCGRGVCVCECAGP
jgi:hypothetical protein